MDEEIFQSWREFNKKFPTKMYQCPICRTLTTNRIYCEHCGFRADGLFGTLERGYKFKILNMDYTEECFKPIELFKIVPSPTGEG